MANGNSITIAGNVTREPELRFSNAGNAWITFSIAYNKRKKDSNGEWVSEAAFFDVKAFGEMAENFASSAAKGDRVMILGTLDQESWETDSGDKRSKVVLIADEVAASLRWATAEIARTPRDGAVIQTRAAAPAADPLAGIDLGFAAADEDSPF